MVSPSSPFESSDEIAPSEPSEPDLAVSALPPKSGAGLLQSPMAVKAVAFLLAVMAASSLAFVLASSLADSGAAPLIEPAPTAAPSTTARPATTVIEGGPVSVPDATVRWTACEAALAMASRIGDGPDLSGGPGAIDQHLTAVSDLLQLVADGQNLPTVLELELASRRDGASTDSSNPSGLVAAVRAACS